MFCTKNIIYYVLLHQVEFKTGTSHMYQPVTYFEALKRRSPFLIYYVLHGQNSQTLQWK
jgi:hypothetical protein